VGANAPAFSSTRIGSMTKSFRPVIFTTFCVVTTLPVTRAMNISTTFQQHKALGTSQKALGTWH
jgi:hypothetical protein